MAKPEHKKEGEMDPALTAAAFGENVIDSGRFDLGGAVLNGILTAIESLLGKRDKSDPVPASSARGREAIHGIVQDLVSAQVASYVWNEMTYATDPKPSHVKPPLDAKEIAMLSIDLAGISGLQDRYEFVETAKPREVQPTPHPDDAERIKKAKEKQADEVAKNPSFQVGAVPRHPRVDIKPVSSKPQSETKPVNTQDE